VRILAAAALISISGCFPIPHVVVDINPPTKVTAAALHQVKPKPATWWLSELAAGRRP
jgi:hypothetical protein